MTAGTDSPALTSAGHLRARAVGIPFAGTPGPHNAITDVAGVEVGMQTLIHGEGPLRVGSGPVRTGVTAILPRGRAGVGDACAAGVYAFNGNGEMTGTAWIQETGSLNLPILLTNSHAIGACHRGVIDWLVRDRPDLARAWLMPVVAETYDGYLNDINGDHVTPATAVAALDVAAGGAVAEGSVGGGTGMNCYGYKGGTGTASRMITFGGLEYTVGVLVQANFGARHELTIAGVPLGQALRDEDPLGDPTRWAPPAGAGSIIAVVATDAPLLPGQCAALTRRVPLGLARTGTTGSHFSGDLFLAFSTANPGALASHYPDPDREKMATLHFVPWGYTDRFYEATVQAVEEAVINAMVGNTEMTGRDGNRIPALPHNRVAELLSTRGVL
ncbi:P1 family peptidase [Micromonospora phytophila]|uniref:DmpA family aminopeptidase n=1 Tax=Micromonospora phytophila TaxID=709888 RepID=UPI002030260B|nr:P1 family peptidase [Micromonospora phytophila]MCM0673307.1 P1 family peptidase [Micromonospora phytophila]